MENLSRSRTAVEVGKLHRKNPFFNEKFKMNQRSNKKAQMNKNTLIRRNYGAESSEDDEETLSDFTNDRVELCATCNLAIVETDRETFSQRPLLCHRCIKRLDSKTDINYCITQTDSQHSESSFSQSSNDDYNNYQQKIHSNRTYKVPELFTRFEEPTTNRYIQSSSKIHLRVPSISTTTSIYDWKNYSNNCRKRLEPQISNQKTNNYRVKKEDSIIRDQSEMKLSYQTLECSRRPIRCPRLDCAVNVAFSALTHHFLFDHPEVPVISVDPGMKSTVVFGHSTISGDSSRCLALLLVSDKLPEGAERLFNGSHIHDKYRNRLPLPVLVAKLRRRCFYTNTGEIPDGDTYGEGDVIIVWIAGLDVRHPTTKSLRCSIQAVDSIDNESIRSLMYSGPINSLRTAQNPRQVLVNGDCLILHEGFVNNVVSDNTNLNVNIIVH